MRTSVSLDQSLVNELLRITGAKTKAEAVAAAIQEQIRRAKRAELSGLLGRIEFDDSAGDDAKRADSERETLLQEIGR